MLLLATNTTLVTLSLILHILAGIYFALGAVFSTLLTLQVPNTPTLLAKARVLGQNSMVARAMIIPGSLLAGITGFLVAGVEGGRLQQKWVWLSIALYLVALTIGIVSGPLLARLRRQAEREARSGKKISSELISALRSPVPLVLAIANVVILTIIVVLMYAKPF